MLPTTVVPEMGTSATNIPGGRPQALLPARRTSPSPHGAASKPGIFLEIQASGQHEEPLGQKGSRRRLPTDGRGPAPPEIPLTQQRARGLKPEANPAQPREAAH